MRHPLWILNSALLIALFMVLYFIIFARPTLPEWESLEPDHFVRPIQKKAPEINIAKIYEHDLFDTYQPEVAAQERGDIISAFPQPPMQRQAHVPKEPTPQFFEPLKIALKGIIVVNTDDTKNRAIIADTRTKKEEILKIGDYFEDAQLIKIFNKKVIFLRSNGQQEVLYLRAKDALNDPTYETPASWKDIVRSLDEDTYLINTQLFIQRVQNLAHLIELFDLTTVYAQGESMGARIGRIQADGLAAELGFKPNDIIIAINDMPAARTEDRMHIYETITALQTKDSIVVELLRNNKPLTLTYILDTFKPEKKQQPSPQAQPPITPTRPTPEQIDILQERHKFAPTLRDIRTKERETMINKGRKQLSSHFTE